MAIAERKSHTGKLPFTKLSSSSIEIRRSEALGGTGLAGGIMTSSYSYECASDFFVIKLELRMDASTSCIVLVVPRGNIYFEPS